MTTLQAPVKGFKVTNPWNAQFGAVYTKMGYKGHNGDDYACPHGTPVYAAAAGTIVHSDYGQNHAWMGEASGICVLIRHDDRHTDYCHLSRSLHNPGDKVKAGQLIGYVGDTGAAIGPHLHFSQLPLKPDFNNGYAGRVKPVYGKPKAKPKAGAIQWKVQKGDHLGKIAAYYNGPTVNQIAAANGISNANRIKVGDVLTIPGRLEWRVERGDTLARIAKYYAVSVDYLAKLNGIKNVNNIDAGQVLRIQ